MATNRLYFQQHGKYAPRSEKVNVQNGRKSEVGYRKKENLGMKEGKQRLKNNREEGKIKRRRQ